MNIQLQRANVFLKAALKMIPSQIVLPNDHILLEGFDAIGVENVNTGSFITVFAVDNSYTLQHTLGANDGKLVHGLTLAQATAKIVHNALESSGILS